ncbi:MAG: hypothetical protein FD123_1307 [Bacteroidetes bacterium]|nr:MAG: hypothetical protein FD123_1307 [Bacteroidota bacterium]
MKKPADNFDLNELLQKDKAELDRIKTALEIASFHERQAFEKKKYRTETIRIFAIAIMTSLITLGTTYLFKEFDRVNAQVGSAQKELADLKKEFAGKTDPEQKRQFACSIAGIYNPQNDSYVEKEKKRFQQFCDTMTKTLAAIETQGSKIDQTDTSSVENRELIAKIDAYEKNINDLEAQKSMAKTKDEQQDIEAKIKSIDSEIRKEATTSPEINAAVKSTEAISKNRVLQIMLMDKADEVVRATNSVKKYEVQWFKEGYFLQFDDMRILLQYLDKKIGIQVEVCQTNSPGKCDKPIVTKAWVSMDKPLGFTSGNFRYELRLQAIDHAGRNPFTEAAYITLEKFSN